MIDKVLNVTGLDKLLYIGYSMGTTSFFTMMSQKPEYNSKIVAFLALAPAVYLDNVKPLATLLLKTVNVPVSIYFDRSFKITCLRQFELLQLPLLFNAL